MAKFEETKEMVAGLNPDVLKLAAEADMLASKLTNHTCIVLPPPCFLKYQSDKITVDDLKFYTQSWTLLGQTMEAVKRVSVAVGMELGLSKIPRKSLI